MRSRRVNWTQTQFRLPPQLAVPTKRGGDDVPRPVPVQPTAVHINVVQCGLRQLLDDTFCPTQAATPRRVSPVVCGAVLTIGLFDIPYAMMCGDVCVMIGGSGPLAR